MHNYRHIMNPSKLLLITCTCLAVGLLCPQNQTQAQEARFFRVLGPVAATQSLAADGTLTFTNAFTNALFTVQITSELDTNVWLDYVQVPVNGTTTSVRLYDPNPPSGMTLIPAGSFDMGDATGDDNTLSALPVHPVQVSAFYMDRFEVTKALWDSVIQWATNNGYVFQAALYGKGKATNHPVHSVRWIDAAAWCNARSEMEGLTPCYHTNATLTAVYREPLFLPEGVNWSANGYRLPTEAEWEKAARGGLSGKRFPWGDTITHSNANYYSLTNVPFDANPSAGPHPTFEDGASIPYTSPVGYFPPNGYGLYDMTGNVQEICWDYKSNTYYASSPGTDPRGPAYSFPSVTSRVARGGWWNDGARPSLVARRNATGEFNENNTLGFRCARNAGP